MLRTRKSTIKRPVLEQNSLLFIYSKISPYSTMSCTCYLVFKEKKAVLDLCGSPSQQKLDWKTDVPSVKISRFFLREGGRLYTGYPERSAVLLPQLVLISAMCESFRPLFIRVYSWPCHVVLLVASLKNVPALLIFLGVNKLKHYIFIYVLTEQNNQT